MGAAPRSVDADVKLAFVSTYPPSHCGIGDYTAALRSALRPWLSARVIAEDADGLDAQGTRDARVRRVWDRDADYVPAVLEAVDAMTPDVVHVQHEDAILGRDARALRLVQELTRRNVAVVVTLHSVYPRAIAWPWGKREPSRFYRGLTERGALLVVHQHHGMADRLREQGVPEERIDVISHGTPELAMPDQAAARRDLDLPAGAPIALFLGFIHGKKGVDTLLTAFRACGRPDARLLIAGEVRLSGRARRRFERELGDSAGVIFRPGFVAPANVPRYLSAADVVCLPHRQDYGSASGVLHLALAAGRAVLCSDGPKFSELAQRYRARIPELAVRPGDAAAWALALGRALADPELRARSLDVCSELARETRWEESARRHVALYSRLKPASASRTAGSAGP